MKIVYALPSVCLCGGVVHFLTVARGLLERGHEVEIWTSDTCPEDVERMFPAGYPVAIHAHSGPPINMYGNPPESRPSAFLRSISTQLRYRSARASDFPSDADIIHCGFYPNVFDAAYARRKGHRARIVQAVHHPPRELLRRNFRRWGRLYGRALCLADARLTVSGHSAECIRNEFGLESDIVHNGVDADILGQLAACEENEREPYLLSVGSLTGRKGLSDLFAALARIPQAPRLVVVGSGNREYFATRAAHYGVENLVEWKGAVSREELILLYRKALLMVFPSHSEGFGLPPLESMALGTAVVLTDCGGVWEYAKPDHNCRMAPPGCPSLLALAIASLLEDKVERSRLARNAQQDAQRFTWDKVVDNTERVMKSLLNASDSEEL
jgi:glycosyltransferase involved in cell wall biosynthesis